MALSREKKNQVVAELSALFGGSKMTVVARYRGLTVKAMQNLRNSANENETKIKVVKNRLVRQALSSSEALKDTDTSALKDQLLYAFNANDEVAPAQVLHSFAKKEEALEFVGAITADGKFLSSEEVKALATLPSKDQLIAGIINTLQSPVRNVVSGLSGQLPAIISGLEAKAK